jgi:CheY-like chemotaxis protein
MATVLVIEDEFGIADLFNSILTDEGHHVFIAINGQHGLDLLVRERPDLVFLDYMMPVLDGAGVLGVMASAPDLRDIPVVMMSSMLEAAVAERCAGYAAFMVKPFRVGRVVELVGQLLGTAKGGASRPR